MTAEAGLAWVPYCGAAPAPASWLERWNFDPVVLIALSVLAILVARNERRAMGAAGLALLALLFVTPFCALTSALFSARVTHHIVLTALVAPLLVSTFTVRLPGSLILWTTLQALIFWAWHAPPAYAAALSDHAVYWTMQISLLGSAIGFWASLRRASAPAAIAALILTTVQMGLLGALITFAGAPLYAPHYVSTAAWGLTPLEDQQIGGLVMWAPAAALYLAAALVVAQRWFAHEERASAR